MAEQQQIPAMAYKRNPVGTGFSFESSKPMNGAEKPARLQIDNVGGNPRLRVYDNKPVPEGQKVTPAIQANLGNSPFCTLLGAIKKALRVPDMKAIPIIVRHKPRDPETGETGEVQIQTTLYIGRDKEGIIFIALNKEGIDETPKFRLIPSYWAEIPNKELSMTDISEIYTDGLVEYLSSLMAATAVDSFQVHGPGGGGGGQAENTQRGYQPRQNNWKDRQNNGGGNNNYQPRQNNWKDRQGGGGNNDWKNKQGGGGNGNWKDRQGGGDGNWQKNNNWKDRQGNNGGGNSNWKDRQNNGGGGNSDWKNRQGNQSQGGNNYNSGDDLPI